VASHGETISQPIGTLASKEREFEDTKAHLVISKEEQDGALDSLWAPIRINNQEDAKQMIRVGHNDVKRLESVKKQFVDQKLCYSDVAPS